MLVVVGIIAVLAAIVAIGLGGNLTRAGGARGAADLAASLSHAARLEAMSMGLGSLLVVDNGADDRYRLRRLAIFRRVPAGGNSTASVLQLSGSAVMLQDNIFFLKNYSKGFNEMKVEFRKGQETDVLAYEFTPTGHIKASGAAPEFRLVFGPGPLNASGDPATDAAAAARAGIYLRINGRPTFFTHPDQMPKNP